jgi:hypothetical protein
MGEEFEQKITETEYRLMYRNSPCKYNSNKSSSEEATSPVTLAAGQ